MNTWFTSDLHFGHKNIMKFAPWSRPYENLDQMHEAMIRIWNERVRPGDIVYHLGDLTFFHNYEQIANIMRRLNGQIRCIMGNHDEMLFEKKERFISDGFVYSLENYREENFEVPGSNGKQKQKVVMFHFPCAVWNKNHHNSFQLYGHCHGNFKAVGKQMDVGWDTRDFDGSGIPHSPGPIAWEDIYKLLSKRQMVSQDHHTGERQ